MGEVTIRPAQVAAWGRAARDCGTRVPTAKAKVTGAQEDLTTARTHSLGAVSAGHRFCDHWERQFDSLRTDVVGTGEKLLTTANLASSYDHAAADPFERVSHRVRPGEQP